MSWLEPERRTNGSGVRLKFDGVAVCVVFAHESSGTKRVKLVLSDKFIALYRLQSGDRLQVGFSGDGKLMLRRHLQGNTISGRGFSKKQKKSVGQTCTQPYVAFEANTYPAVYAWAQRFDNRTWIELADKETHWESLS